MRADDKISRRGFTRFYGNARTVNEFAAGTQGPD